MGTFKGNAASSSSQFHVFVTDNPVLETLGISTYTVDSMSEFLSNPQTKNSLDNLAGEKTIDEWKDVFFGNEANTTKQILRFDTNTQSYKVKNITQDLITLAENHDKIQLEEVNYWDKQNELKDIFEIQNSASGCVTFTKKIIPLKPELTEEEEENFNSTFKFYLQFREYRKNDRILAQKGSPIISDTPRRSTGGKYCYRETQEAQAESIGGFYPSIPNADQDNNVAAPLRLTYNKNMGLWESGTQQLLARLLTDIDPAPVTGIDVDSAINAEPSDFYGVNADFNMSGFTTGIAMPLSVHNGNPYTFGPHINLMNNNKDRIRVVNRAPRSFKKGSIVICSLIDSEWIIQDFGGDAIEATKPTKIGSWKFAKFFANSDSFFKDQRFFETGDFPGNIRWNEYEIGIRSKFYNDLRYGTQDGDDGGENVAKINGSHFAEFVNFVNLHHYNANPALSAKSALEVSIDNTVFDRMLTLSKNYFTSTIFDQFDSKSGGTGAANALKRTNLYIAPDGIDDVGEVTTYKMPTFWGPIFPDGYNAGSVSRAKNLNGNFTLVGSGLSGLYSSVGQTPSNTYNTFFTTGSQIKAFYNDENIYSDKSNSMFSDKTDVNLKQFPAEIATNGPFSEGTAPIEDYPFLFIALTPYKPTFDHNLVSAITTYLNSPTRFLWLGNDTGTTPAYGLEPVNPNKLQFSLCQLEFAAHADAWATVFKLKDQRRAFHYIYRDQLEEAYRNTPHFFGKMFDRVMEQNPSIKYPPPFNELKDCNIFKPDIPIPANDFQTLPYDCYIRQNPTSSIMGSPPPFGDEWNDPKEGANLVGVVIAKNKFYRRNGGSLNILSTNSYGLKPKVLNTGGWGGGISIIPIGVNIGIQQPKGDGVTVTTRYWGSNNGDQIDSFGTAGLWVRVFDAWPDANTIYDPRYYGILHFNPGTALSIPTVKQVGEDVPENPLRDVDEIEFDIDFRIPTYGFVVDNSDPDAITVDISNDNKVVPEGTLIDKDTVLRSQSEWRVNTIRRGMILTQGGFKYTKRVIGLDNVDQIINPGSGFAVNQEITANGATFVITGVDDNGGISTLIYKENFEGYPERGSGFMPESFETLNEETGEYGIFITLTSTGENAENAEIFIKHGMVYDQILKDIGPVEHTSGGPTVLSIGSNSGSNKSVGQKSTEIAVASNTSGEYDAFYFCQNDVSFVVGAKNDLGLLQSLYSQFISIELS